MKLYHICWNDAGGNAKEDHLAMPDEADQPVSLDDVTNWLVEVYRQLWYADFSADDVNNLDVIECSGVKGINGEWYEVTLKPAPHLDTLDIKDI